MRCQKIGVIQKKKKKKLTTIWIFQHKLITRNMTETKKFIKQQKKKKKKAKSNKGNKFHG